MSYCFHKDTEWMNLDPGEKLAVDEIVKQEQPLKEAPCSHIFSDYIFCEKLDEKNLN